jgi:hypothetical protein
VIRVKVHKCASLNSLPTEERLAWRRHNLQTLTESSALPFKEQLAILEDLEKLTVAMVYERDFAGAVSANATPGSGFRNESTQEINARGFQRALAQCKPEDYDGHTVISVVSLGELEICRQNAAGGIVECT